MVEENRAAPGTTQSHTAQKLDGVLDVEEVFLGNEPVKNSVQLQWIHLPDFSTSIDPRRYQGTRGVWLLRKTDDGKAFTFYYPGRVLPISQIDYVRTLLRRPFYTIKIKERDAVLGKPLWATFTISTVQDEVSTEDYLSISGEKLRLHGNLYISMRGASKKIPCTSLVGKAEKKAITIKKNSPLQTTIDLSKYFILKDSGSYEIRWGPSEENSSYNYTFSLKQPRH